MHGTRIIGILAALLVAAVVYVLLPSDEDLVRRDEDIDQHRAVIEVVLTDCAELVRFLDRFKPTEMKKVELARLRQRFEQQEQTAGQFLNDSSIPRSERRRGLDDLENDYYNLKRDCEDLRARLREMRAYQERRMVAMAENGLLRRHLQKAQAASTDSTFLQRANELIDECQSAYSLADEAMRLLAQSITEGRPVAEAALNELSEIDADIRSLLDSIGYVVQAEDGTGDS